MKTHKQIEKLRAVVSLRKHPLAVSALLLLGGGLTQAQPNISIAWSVIAGGGGTSTNGPLSLSGTIGQHDASQPMTGGSFSLTGGFWAGVVAVQTTGAPVLSITRAGGSIVLSWPGPATGYVLEQSPGLSTGLWTDVNQAPVDSGGIRSVTVTLGPGATFFRLKK